MSKMLKILIGIFITGAVLISGCLQEIENKPYEETAYNETFENTPIPYIENRVESYNLPAYRGTSVHVTLHMLGRGVTKGTEISLDYKTGMVHTDGSFESEPEEIDIIPEQKRLIFPRTVAANDWDINLLKSNFTLNISKEAAEGDYFTTVTTKYRGLVIGSNVLSFKIGKGGKRDFPGRSAEVDNLLNHLHKMNIGYMRYQSPPLSETERAWAKEIVMNDTYLIGKQYNITEISSEFHESGNFAGFFPVVKADIGEPDKSGEIVTYIIDLEERKVLKSNVAPRIVEYLKGQAFDEKTGNFTSRWDAGNFSGFWHDSETNASTELLIINQSILNNSHRVIEKHNLIYTTRSIPLKYQVYAQANTTPSGTDSFYSAIGWQGEKYVYLDGNRLARIIFEQNASEVITLIVGGSWDMGDGWTISAQSIDAKAAAKQAWFVLINNKTKLYDIVLAPRRPWSYLLNNDSVPIFITYFNKISVGSYTDEADLKHTWLRSQDITEIKEGDAFGIMEVTSIDNGTIELRNKKPIDLSPGDVVNLMGNISIQVGNSEDALQFHPFRVRRPWTAQIYRITVSNCNMNKSQ